MGRVASTYWESGAKSSTRRMSMRRGVGVSRAVDGIIITVILAAIAICVDLYFRSESEMARPRLAGVQWPVFVLEGNRVPLAYLDA